MYLEVNNLKKNYDSGEGFVEVLKGISTSVEKGKMCVIQETSGSGSRIGGFIKYAENIKKACFSWFKRKSLLMSKIVMDSVYPLLISNIGCSMNLHFPWYLYVAIYAGIIMLYLIISHFLVLRLKKITPAQVLKNRE